MTEAKSAQMVRHVLAPALRIHLLGGFQAWSKAGTSVLPRARKARALLALIALSGTKSIMRRRAVALLWSGLERASGLARLRDTLHHLQKDFAKAGVEALRLEGENISFRMDAVWVDIEHHVLSDVHPIGTEELLVDLEGVDPAFDQLLIRVRDERRQIKLADRPNEVFTQVFGVENQSKLGPSIVVVEFATVGARIEGQMAWALTEDVGGALAKLRWIKVLMRINHGRRLSADMEDLSKIADYALVGTLQRSENNYRLSLKLLDLSSHGTIVWVWSFEQEKRPGFAIQERFASAAVSRLDSELFLIEAERRRHWPLPHKDDAYALVLQAIPAIYRLERQPFLGAGHALEQAVAMDRNLAMAHSWLAYWHVFLVGQGWAINPFQSLTRAGKAAERAMMLDPKDARGVTVAGHVKAFLSRQLDEAAALHELALQLNPALALAWHFSGMTHAYAGRLDEAYRCVSHCRDLAPGDPHAFFAEGALGIVHLLRHDHEAAAVTGRHVTERHPQFTSGYKSYLAALGHLGQKSEATSVLRRLRLLEPRFSLRRFHSTAPYQRAQDLQHYTAGLRLAGVT